MSSNLPDGVTESMIPGNRPEDMREEAFWNALFEKLEGSILLKRIEDRLGEFWHEEEIIEALIIVARDLGWDEGFGEGRDEERMSQMTEECIRCGYAHSVQEHCHCGRCDYSHSPTDPCVVD